MTQTPNITTRPVREDDYWRIYRLLIDTVPIAPPGFNWDMRRWEGRRFYDANPEGDPNWRKGARLWETEDGQLAGIAHPDGAGMASLQVHPDYRHLEGEMIDWAEQHLTAPVPEKNGRQLHFFVYSYDVLRQSLLTERGYEQMTYGGVIRHLRFGAQPLARPQLADGYSLRTVNPENGRDAAQIAVLLNAAFGRTFHNAAEYQNFTRRAPSYRQELDLVAVAPDATFAAYVGVLYDADNRRGLFEPVCTHPDHRQRGLAKALMQEGLLRLRAMDAVDVNVETGDMVPANKLYNSIGFTEMYKGYYWRRLF